MNVLLDAWLLSWIVVGLGLAQLAPALAALVADEPVLPWAASAVAALVCGASGVSATQAARGRPRPRDGFLLVASAALLASLFGALPYLTTGVLGPVDALFEAVAGFTTTAASVLASPEAAPRSLLLWRALTQWLGGLGVVFAAIAMLPLFGIGGMQLFPTSLPRRGPDTGRGRLGGTGRRLAAIYLALSAAACLCLWAAGMGPFDALCHGLATVATGGFSTRDGSIGAFGSPAVEWVVVLFMLLSATSYASHLRFVTGAVRRALADAELRYYVATAAVCSAVVFVCLRTADPAPEGALRASVFQVVSMLSGTGFHTSDFAFWPPLTQVVLVGCMLLGGMAGSTTGGIKSLRLLLGMRALAVTLLRLLHPRALRHVKYAGRTVPEEVVAGVWAFFTAFFLVVVLTAALLAAVGQDLVTSISLAMSAASNVGPALGDAGPGTSLGALPAVAKLGLAASMLAGRLEVFVLFVIFRPSFWRR